ncbi:UNVERIFIED_CONTAM: hypothetical protein Scaly_0744200 [Sesamum calycinum]|uniref:Neprosin activation peptide domain-containing protein n=1 Tax=Sesamum calycinum TaxID=2727403 RepID=A0AAW2R892_9LAMI
MGSVRLAMATGGGSWKRCSLSPDGISLTVCTSLISQLDHPFLKDHKIQMRPSYHPEGLFDENKRFQQSLKKEQPITQLWHMNGKCPEDTIPLGEQRKRCSESKLC